MSKRSFPSSSFPFKSIVYSCFFLKKIKIPELYEHANRLRIFSAFPQLTILVLMPPSSNIDYKLDSHIATILVLDREPSLTIRTNSYHFCKLSLVKNSIANMMKGKETVDIEISNDSRVKTAENQVEGSNTFEGLFMRFRQVFNIYVCDNSPLYWIRFLMSF